MRLAGFILLVAVGLAAFRADASETNLLAKLAPVAPFPSAVAAATGAGIVLTGFDHPTNDGALEPGDTVTGLATLREHGRSLTQWVICFTATNNPPKRAAKEPPEPPHPLALYTSTGDRYEFARSPASIRVRVLGPFKGTNSSWWGRPSVGDHLSVAFVDEDFLSLGQDAGAAALMRWTQAAKTEGGTNFLKEFRVAGKPFGADRTNRVGALARRWQVTTAEERGVAALNPALDAYFSTVGETPKLEDMLWKVLSLPSVWSLVKNAGVEANIELKGEKVRTVPLPGWDLPGNAPVYALPSLLTINQHPALAVTMLVTAPRPPLRLCGGVAGFLAENPSDEENYLTFRIVSGHLHRP